MNRGEMSAQNLLDLLQVIEVAAAIRGPVISMSSGGTDRAGAGLIDWP